MRGNVRRGTFADRCADCGQPSGRPGQRMCAEHHAAYMRVWRAARTAELKQLRRAAGLPARRQLKEARA